MEPYQQLESEFGRWVGTEDVVACNSGTAALHLALESLDLPLGSTVAVPEFTMVSCARAVTLAGLKPWFVDCNDDLLMNPELLKRAPNDLSAIMAVHIYGRRCDMDKIAEIADRRNVRVIEDMAEIHGINPHHSTDAACWSFYRNKIVAGEEGGAVAFRSSVHCGHARKLRSLGFTDAHDFHHIPRGHNYRLANALAKLILSSLHGYDTNLHRRRILEREYDDALPPSWHMPPRWAPWVYDFKIEGMKSEQQDALVLALQKRGIAARHAFKPMSSQREYRGTYRHLESHRLSKEVVYLPLDPVLLGTGKQTVETVLFESGRLGIKPSDQR